MSTRVSQPVIPRREQRWPAISAGTAVVLAISAMLLVFGARSLADPTPACASDRTAQIDRMALAAGVLAAVSIIVGAAAAIGGGIRKRVAPAIAGVAAIGLASVAGAAVLQGYQCYSVTALLGTAAG
jgi:hypothetical protein